MCAIFRKHQVSVRQCAINIFRKKDMSIRNLSHLLNPQSVALIGASSKVGSLGSIIWKNLTTAGFRGNIYPVNLKYKLLDRVRVYKSVSKLPEVVDLVIICTPPDTVVDLLSELGSAKVKAVIVITAGLSADQKLAMLNVARPHLLRILGPNCLGLMSPKIGLNASFSQTQPLIGDLAIVSQSGALTTAILDWAKFRGIGFSHMISLGECTDVDCADLLDFLGSDSATKAIILYIESIHLARKFMSAARAAARNKPVIVLKAGRSEKGAVAAATHSGSLAGSDIVFDAAIRRSGMLRVDTLQEMFTAAMALTRRGSRTNASLTVVTNGGGAGVIAADWAARHELPLTSLNQKTLDALDIDLPVTWSKSNPIDIIGDAPIARYEKALQSVLADTDDSLILLIHAPTALVASKEIATACVATIAKAKDRVMGCWLGDESVREARGVFREAGIADYATPEEAVTAFSMMRTYWRHQELLMEVPPACALVSEPDSSTIRLMIAKALASGRTWLTLAEVDELLHRYGIETPKLVSVTADRAAVITAATDVGYPLALKIDSEQIQHKFDVGGIALGLNNDQELGLAFDTIMARLHEKLPTVKLERFVLQQMVERKGAIELIIGSYVDTLFGPVVLFGKGGTSVEVTKDRAIGLPPLNSILADELINSAQVAKEFIASRGRAAVELEAVSMAVIAVSAMLADIPEILEMDINPLLADASGVIALDARVRISKLASSGRNNFAIMPYPKDLVESVIWRGENIILRPIRPEDESQHRQFLEQLLPEDIRMRIFFTKRELPRSELARLTQIDYQREMAFIAEREAKGGARQTLAAVRVVSDPDGFSAEFALIIRSDLKRQGLGRVMLTKAIVYARQKGLTQLVGTLLRENIAMRELVTSLGFVSDSSAPIEREAVNVILKL
jgi:acetyltransferase